MNSRRVPMTIEEYHLVPFDPAWKQAYMLSNEPGERWHHNKTTHPVAIQEILSLPRFSHQLSCFVEG